MEFDKLLMISELISYVVTSISLPLAIYTFVLQKQKDKESDEEKTFHQLDESYVSFLELCLNHPDLDVFDLPTSKSYSPTEDQLRREQAIFGILISLFERSHVMFRDKSPDFRGAQWDGWVKYIKSYCYRPNFERVWDKIGDQFDSEFYEFMKKLIIETKSAKNTLNVD